MIASVYSVQIQYNTVRSWLQDKATVHWRVTQLKYIRVKTYILHIKNRLKLEAKDVLPNFNHMQAAEKAEIAVSCPCLRWRLTFDRDL